MVGFGVLCCGHRSGVYVYRIDGKRSGRQSWNAGTTAIVEYAQAAPL
jgi:hypothetical protein